MNKNRSTWNCGFFLLLWPYGKEVKTNLGFFWPGCEKTAEHHEIHLKEFIQIKKLNHRITEVENSGENQFTAFLVVDESEMIPVRDALKPNRGEWYEV